MNVEVLKNYKVEPSIIDAVVELYKRDRTQIDLGNERKLEMNITSGMKQGCTGSTSLFKLITYEIITEPEEKGKGYIE